MMSCIMHIFFFNNKEQPSTSSNLTVSTNLIIINMKLFYVHDSENIPNTCGGREFLQVRLGSNREVLSFPPYDG